MRAVKLPRLEGGSIGPRTESWVNGHGPMAMVPCFHQGNIYTKRKLRVWRNQKCIPLVAAITPLTCAGHQNIQSRGRQCRALQANIYTKRKLQVCRNQKCFPLVGAITPFTCACCQNTPSRGRQYRAKNGKLGKLGRTYGHGTRFALRKY